LDIIATQFGPLIKPQQLEQMKRDLADLERTLDEEQASELPVRKPDALVQIVWARGASLTCLIFITTWEFLRSTTSIAARSSRSSPPPNPAAGRD
jgi:hypothetical protein